MNERKKTPALVAGPAVFAIALTGLGLSGCGNSGEGQIQVGSAARKNLADDAVPSKKESPFKEKGADKDLKNRVGGRQGEN